MFTRFFMTLELIFVHLTGLLFWTLQVCFHRQSFPVSSAQGFGQGMAGGIPGQVGLSTGVSFLDEAAA